LRAMVRRETVSKNSVFRRPEAEVEGWPTTVVESEAPSEPVTRVGRSLGQDRRAWYSCLLSCYFELWHEGLPLQEVSGGFFTVDPTIVVGVDISESTTEHRPNFRACLRFR
jgi:hypothetical protein